MASESLVLALLLGVIGTCWGEDEPPVFVNNMRGLQISESTEVGTSVYTLSATGEEPIIYDIKADMFTVNATTGVVTLSRPVDYESGEIKFSVQVIAIANNGLVETVSPTVEVLDANDNPPQFLRETYRQIIPEDYAIGNEVISNLRAEDKDFKGGVIVVTCEPDAILASPNNTHETHSAYVEACETFEPVMLQSSNKRWLGSIRLLKTLDYETRSTYQLPLVIRDGTLAHMQSFEITISDVNDAPPRFTYVPENVPIKENLDIGTVIERVQAEDGDTNKRRPIRYNVTRCPEDTSARKDADNIFTVNFLNGTISTKTNIDRENAFVIAGLKLCIKAQELNNKTIPISLGNDSETTAVALIHIDVQDLNDQIPSFSNDNYNTSIYEDIPDGTAVPGIALTITDLDSYPANSYDVRLVNYQDVFEVFPVNGTGRNIGGIKVKDTSKIDYESGNRLFELRIIAYENRFAEGGFQPNTGSTKVSIHVLDVNDNTPKFSQNVYNVSVMEKDIGTQPFITYIQAIDPDSGPMGTTGITYRLLGSESERFQIEPTRRGRSAEVRVSPCRTPGQGGDCINYERRRRYDFTIIARDELGSPKGRQGTAELVIHVIDENDVWPVFTLNSYVGDIKEGELLLVNELRVKAEDTDTVGKISYTLSPGSQYWRIHPDTGLISAKETIFRRFTPGDRGWFNLIVLANDTVNTVSTDVIINVIDQNNFAPKFSPNVYITKIPEETKGDVSVITVEATDQDSSLSENGQVEYNIEEGSQGRFVMNNGTIYTATNAAFDYDVQKEYILRVLARDGGNPQKTGTSSVTISIIDQNNKLPYFLSLVQFAEISENAQKGEYVTTILAKDPDEDAKLSFELVEEIKAISPDGVNVDPNDYAFKNLFQLDSTSGVVRVNAQRLDRDRTSVITYNMTVTDVSQTPTTGPQIGTPGILIIRIKEYNDQSPAFQRSRYDLSVEEEQPIGTFVVALVAQDADDAIKQYDIVERDQNLFSIISETGVLIVRSRIDYERIERTQFTVRAIDNGQPQRTGTAQVFINIINTNDNSPIPSQNTYQVNIPENSTGGTSLLQVFASDMDKGDYGEIRFELPKDVTRFTINPYSGVMVLAPGVQLDREVEPIIPTRVNVYDSPSDETVRRRYSVPVYVTLLDVNDNWPIFSNEDLSAEIIESIDIGAPILQVFATDRDYGINAQIVFRKVAGSGDTGGLFSVSPQSGQILVERSLRGRIGIYAFNVSATDRNGGPDGLKGYSRIVITVVESLNSPPVWTIPPNDNMTIEVLESQYLGMLVFDANADDNNSGRNGIVEYYFQDGNTTVSNTGEFSINRVTGVIRAEIIYDRETVERYTLHLIAKDMGVLSLRSERHLYVKIIDVNDNIPEFEMSNGKTIPMDILLWENTTVGAAIGSVKATDDDSEFYTTIYYYIVAGGEGKFAVDKDTGVIRLSQAVDREIRSTYSFDIRATNADNDYFLITNRNAIDTSIITVRVTLRDVNDNAPVFVGFNSLDAANNHYFGFISLNAPYDQRIVQVTATDVDAAGSAAITYNIIGGNDDGGFFTVDMIGRVANKRLLNEVTTRIYSLTIQAFDSLLTSTATTYVFVTNAGNEVKLVINLEPSEVKVFRSQIIRLLMSFPGISHASILSIKNHVVGQVVDTTRSDVIVVAATAVPAGGYVLLSTSQLLLLLQEKRRESGAVFHSFYVESIGPAGVAATWLDWTPVLAVVIIIILLILMAILLLLFCCCCIKDSGKKKPQTPVAYLIGEKDEKKINPVFDNSISIVETTDAKVVTEVEELYAVVAKTTPASNATVSHDPYPFVDDDNPVIETEVIRGRAIGSSEVTIQVGPDVNDGPLPVIEALINENSDTVAFSAAVASESQTSSSQVVQGGDIDTYFFTPQPEPDTESGSKYPYPSVQPSLEPLAEHSEQEESQDEENDNINTEIHDAQDVRISQDAYTHMERVVTYEDGGSYEVDVQGGYPEGTGQNGSFASSGSVGTSDGHAGGNYEIEIHGGRPQSTVDVVPSTSGPTYEVEVQGDNPTVDQKGTSGGVNYEIEIHGGRPQGTVDVVPSTSGPTYEVEVQGDDATVDQKGTSGGVNYEIEIHGGRPQGTVDVVPSTSGPTYEVEVQGDDPTVDQKGTSGGVNYEIEIHGGRPQGTVDVVPSTSGPTYEVEVQGDDPTVDERRTSGGVNYEIEIHGGRPNSYVHIDPGTSGPGYEVEVQPNSPAGFEQSYPPSTVGDGDYEVEIQDGHPDTSIDILPATSAPFYDVDVQGEFPVITDESDNSSALVPSSGDRSYGVEVPGGDPIRRGAVAPPGYAITETEKSMHSTSAAQSSRVISSPSPLDGGNVTVAETHSSLNTASAHSRSRMISYGEDDGVGVGVYESLREVDDENMAVEFPGMSNSHSPGSPHPYVYLSDDAV